MKRVRCEKRRPGLASDHGETIRQLVARVAVHDEHLEIDMVPGAVAALFDLPAPVDAPASIKHVVAVRLTHNRKVGRLIEANGAAANARPDPALIQNLLKARRWWQELAKGHDDVTTFAAREGVNPSYLTRIIRLQFLAPSITTAILAGAIREEVGSRVLIATSAIAHSWTEQEERFLPN